jgi:hypothetical protein
MCVVTRVGFVFHVRGRDRDPAGLLLRRTVTLVIRLEVAEILGDRRRQRRLAVVNVTNRANVAVRLAALKLFVAHCKAPFLFSRCVPGTHPTVVGRVRGFPRTAGYAYFD